MVKAGPPCADGRVLLHVCCAPCSGAVIEMILESGVKPALYFYNPNIHPDSEYQKRRECLTVYAQKKGLEVLETAYNPQVWRDSVKGLEGEPERGGRCRICFEIRLSQTALAAYQNNYLAFATTLGISRWKDMDMVNSAGRKAAGDYPFLRYWDCNWREGGGQQRMREIALREGFYMQKYCGCEHSQKARQA